MEMLRIESLETTDLLVVLEVWWHITCQRITDLIRSRVVNLALIHWHPSKLLAANIQLGWRKRGWKTQTLKNRTLSFQKLQGHQTVNIVH